MIPIINFAEFIVDALLSLAMILLFATAIVSWLVAFDVINLRNPTAHRIVYALERLTRPIIAPFQRFIPTFGGVDLSFIFALLVIIGLRRYLLPPAFDALRGLFF